MVNFCNYTVHTFSDLCLHIWVNASQVSSKMCAMNWVHSVIPLPVLSLTPPSQSVLPMDWPPAVNGPVTWSCRCCLSQQVSCHLCRGYKLCGGGGVVEAGCKPSRKTCLVRRGFELMDVLCIFGGFGIHACPQATCWWSLLARSLCWVAAFASSISCAGGLAQRCCVVCDAQQWTRGRGIEHSQGFMLLDRRWRTLIMLITFGSNWLPAHGISHGVLIGLGLLQMTISD